MRTAPPEISVGAARLLSIALKNDIDKLLTSNRVLECSLTAVTGLPSVGNVEATRLCAQSGLPPEDCRLFAFAVEFMRSTESAALQSLPDKHDDRPRRSEWDHAALLALGQTVCRAGGMRRANNPTVESACSDWAKARPRDLQVELTKNYFGNVLQDYFDACEIRKQVRGLPPETEGKLREVDGNAIAEWISGESTERDQRIKFQQFRDAAEKLAVAVFLQDAGRR